MSYTAKSVILDIVDNWTASTYLGLLRVEFFLSAVRLDITDSDYTVYATSQNEGGMKEHIFDTTLAKIGATYPALSWTSASQPTNQRLVCVLDTSINFDNIVINNYHSTGVYTARGCQNVKINISSDIITSTVYNAGIPNAYKIFDGSFPQHAATNTVQDFELALIPGWNGIIDTPEMITTTSADSDIQLGLVSPEAVVTTSADSSLFIGVPIVTPEIIVTTGAESDLQLNIDSAESVVTTGADSDIQLQLDSPEALVTTASLSGIFTGVLIITPEMLVTTSAESDLQLQLDSPEALVTTEGAGDIQLQLVGPGIIVTTGVSDTSITATLPVIFVSDTDTINITGHGETDGNIVVFDTINTTTGITKNTDYYVINATTDTFQIAATEGGAAIELTNKGSGTIFTYEIITFEIREATLRFYLLVSAGLDGRYDNIEDMEIPVSSFQAKRRDGSTTFLETVVPDYNYLEEIIIINEYDTSSIKIKQGYEKNGVILQKDIIIETNIDRLDYDISVKNSPIMLSGHGYTVNGEYTLKRPSGGVSGTITSLPGYFPASGQHLYKAVLLNIDTKGRDNVILKRMRNGLLYFRLVQPDLTLNPGDSVTIGDDTFIIGLMRFAISAELENLFEISEAS